MCYLQQYGRRPKGPQATVLPTFESHLVMLKAVGFNQHPLARLEHRRRERVPVLPRGSARLPVLARKLAFRHSYSGSEALAQPSTLRSEVRWVSALGPASVTLMQAGHQHE